MTTMMRPAVVVAIVVCILGAAAAAGVRYIDRHKAPEDPVIPERPDLRPAGELILSASDLGPDWQGSAPLPMDLTGLSYTDVAMAGFGWTFSGSEQPFTMAVMMYRGSGPAEDDLIIMDERTYVLWMAENGTMGGVYQGKRGQEFVRPYREPLGTRIEPLGNATQGLYYLSRSKLGRDLYAKRQRAGVRSVHWYGPANGDRPRLDAVRWVNYVGEKLRPGHVY